MTTHQVEAETVHPVFVVPVFHALHHEPPHHLAIRCRFVAATATIGIAPRGVLPIIIVWISPLEVAVLNVVCMIVHHIEYHGNAGLVECLHHLLELTVACQRVVGVGTVPALRHIVVHRVIAPIILWFIESCLVHRAIVIAGQDMHGIYPQLLQMFNGPRLRQRQELARIFRVAPTHGEVTVVQFVDHQVGR